MATTVSKMATTVHERENCDGEACFVMHQTKVTAPPTVPTKRAGELTGDEAK